MSKDAVGTHIVYARIKLFLTVMFVVVFFAHFFAAVLAPTSARLPSAFTLFRSPEIVILTIAIIIAPFVFSGIFAITIFVALHVWRNAINE